MPHILLLFITLFSLTLPLYANDEDDTLKKMIGRMLVVGFEDERVDENSTIVKEMQMHHLGGVILFDRFYTDKTRIKNIRSPKQLQRLTQQLKHFSLKPLLISIDQEGGRVARLKPRDGFEETASAFALSRQPQHVAKTAYQKMALILSTQGINCNFGPVVDLARNEKNSVIVGLERSYGEKSDVVSAYAQLFIDALKEQGVISVLKHFPGHGSSLNDSHLGFVDVTKTWDASELEPYRKLITSGHAKMIMSAHVFNANLDKTYPATLSYATNTKLLREKMGYQGVLISDDLQMEAIARYYTLQEAVTLAINSGIDILLFGNQLSYTRTDEIVNTIFAQVKRGAIAKERIIEANERIEALLSSKGTL